MHAFCARRYKAFIDAIRRKLIEIFAKIAMRASRAYEYHVIMNGKLDSGLAEKFALLNGETILPQKRV